MKGYENIGFFLDKGAKRVGFGGGVTFGLVQPGMNDGTDFSLLKNPTSDCV